MDQRRAVHERVYGVSQGLADLEVDPDPLQRIFGQSAALRQNNGHRLADVTGDSLRQWKDAMGLKRGDGNGLGKLFAGRAQVFRCVSRGSPGLDGARDIDRPNPRVRVGGTEKGRVKGALGGKVIHVSASSFEEPIIFHSGDVGSKPPRIELKFRCHDRDLDSGGWIEERKAPCRMRL